VILEENIAGADCAVGRSVREVGRVQPTLAAEELQRILTQYLTTTFALAEPPVREALERFLTHREQGIFRGPYLRIRTPFGASGRRVAGLAGMGAGRWALLDEKVLDDCFGDPQVIGAQLRHLLEL
jgi:hypothetical protein